MIDLLDRALRTLLRRVEGLGHESQIRFQPPDEQWRAAVANLQVDGHPASSLNVYLVELREDRERRSNQRHRSLRDGMVVEHLAPSWVECHYLISAWSPAASELVEPTPDEHALLYRTLAVLRDAEPVTPSRIYPAGSPELDGWREFRDVELPTELAPVEGFGKLAEFWGTMGAGHRWKPVLQLTVALPVALSTPVERGRPVVTVELTIGPTGRSDARDIWVRIGGQVRRADGTPVAAPAEVAVVSVGDGAVLRETTSERATGQFLLDLPLDVVSHPDDYRLRARTAGSAAAETTVDWRAASHDIELPA
ncbi:MAG TPA: DUF4255 domain-containing protein [Pseudonocardia sp.]|jgi:hypothetical protein|uniref:DUF4255 domain-containing protein n=1 Tax=Pseudonocardia sp. TaxID=60912 RepID=UPI002F3E9680